jgi:transcriptional regulator with XRE-family HTH domain
MGYYKRIRDLREDNDKTQNEIAKYLDMKQPQYCRYESGVRDVPTDILIALADYYNTSTDYILGRTDEIKPYKKSDL